MNDYIHKLTSLWKYTKKGKRAAIPGIIMMILGGAIFAAMPLMGRLYIDELDKSGDVFSIKSEDIFVMIVATVLFVLAWFALYGYGRTKVIRDVSGKKLRDDIAMKTNRIPAASIEDSGIGDISATMANDVPVIVKTMRMEISNFFVQLAILVIILGMMFYLNHVLATVYLVLFIVTYYLTRRIGNRMRRDMETKQDSIGEMNDLFSQSIARHSLIKIYGLEDKAMEMFDGIDSKQSGSYVRTTSVFSFIEPLSRIVDNVGYLLTGVIGAVMIIQNVLSFETFFAFICYAAIIGRPLVSFTDSVNKIQAAAVSYDRVLEFMEKEEMPDQSSYEPIDTESAEGNLEFRDVSFSYPNGTKALDSVSFSISPGSKIAIVGEEGSGKSTVSDMIMGFRQATEGELLLDGKDISTIRRKDLRKLIGISTQTPFLFEGTVYYNLSPTASKEEIIAMSKLTGFDEHVKYFPRGYDTVIGGRGHGLSSGEIQLLSITRLLLYGPKIMIFDESASDMDPITTMSTLDSIKSHFVGKTVIVVDNTPIAAAKADVVVFMSKGKVLDIGTHIELMDRNPAYVEMYRNMLA